MTRQATKNTFLESVEGWICDSYSLTIHYLATVEDASFNLIDALLLVQPLPPLRQDNFALKAGKVVAGREVFPSMKKAELLSLLTKAANGTVEVNSLLLKLPSDTELDYYSETPTRDTGFSELHVKVTGAQLPFVALPDSTITDSELRLATPPFDGLADLCSWLLLSDSRINGQPSSIVLRVGPPVDILFEETRVHGNTLQLTLVAHSKFNPSSLVLTTREFPGLGIETRKHVTNQISRWRAKKGQRKGTVSLNLLNANSVFAMLMVDGRTVRRRWFDDPDKAVNSRYVTTQLFDRDLKQLKLALLESTDSVRFESGVASLLFLLGFSAAIQVETQAPDIIVTTPGGKLAIVECTTKISDFQSKLGKLVDRSNALKAKLEGSGHNIQVGAFLVCGLPKAQIAIEENLLLESPRVSWRPVGLSQTDMAA